MQQSVSQKYRVTAMILLPVVVLSAGLYSSLSRSLWYDEALTVLEFLPLPSYRQIYLSYEIPNNHIAYTMLLRCWTDSVGALIPAAVASARLLSCILAAMATLYISWSWRRRVGRVLASLGGVVFALAFPLDIYGGAIRGYALSLLAGVAGLHAAVLISENRVRVGAPLYAGAAILAVATLPSNLLFFAALAPYLLMSRGQSTVRKIGLAALPFAGILFYIPILHKLSRVLLSKQGWPSAAGCLWHLYGSTAAILLPLVALAGTGLALWLRAGHRTPRDCAMLVLLLAATVLPLAVIVALRPSPFPRVFLIFLPLWIYLGVHATRKWSAWLRRQQCRWSLPAQIAAVVLIAGWGLALHPVRPALAHLFSGDNGRDDLVLPYYLVNFNPEGVVERVAELRHSHTNLQAFIMVDADPLSLLFASRLRRLPDDIWLFDKPKRRLQARDFSTSDKYAVARTLADAQSLCERFHLGGYFLLAQDYGFQKLYVRVEEPDHLHQAPVVDRK